MGDPATFSILHPTGDDVPIPVRFHVSRELWEDLTYSAEDLADVLRLDLVTAITAHRSLVSERVADHERTQETG